MLLQPPDGFRNPVKSKGSNPSFKSAFADPIPASKVSVLTAVRKPIINVEPPVTSPMSFRKPISTPSKPVHILKHPNVQPNVTPRKPVSVIKPPPLPLVTKPDPRNVKTISTTRIATAMDLDTEDGNVELSSLLIQRDYGPDHVPTSSTDKQILRGLEVSPEKAGHNRHGSRRFARSVSRLLSVHKLEKNLRGGLADQASILLSRSQTAGSLWVRQMQSANQKIKPDMRVSIVEVVHTSIRSVLVKCVVLGGLDGTEIQVLLSRPDDEMRLHQGREMHIWQPWMVINNAVLCTRFIVVP
jgi:hypothetical protein